MSRGKMFLALYGRALTGREQEYQCIIRMQGVSQSSPEVGIYRRKILRKKKENTLSTKKKVRFKK